MPNILITALPAVGHVKALLPVAIHLRDMGHRVTFNTAEGFRNKVEAVNLEFVPFIGKANYDLTRMDEYFPDRKSMKPGPDQMNYDMTRILGDALPDQYRGLLQIIEERNIDLILSDVLFFGVFPLLLNQSKSRPPIIACGHTAPLLTTIDASLLSGPDPSRPGRIRNAENNRLWKASLAPSNRYLNRILQQCGVTRFLSFFMDDAFTLPDVTLAFTSELFDGPRSDKPENFHYVGPMKLLPHENVQKPDWLRRLDGSAPVIFVSQGTIANYDLNHLLVPTLEALADMNVQVIAAGGGADVSHIKVPFNAVVESYIPYELILPMTDVFVTNAGFNGVLQALGAGVPIVAAGGSEDHPIVAGRLAHSGAGINLATGTPTPKQIREAVRNILTDDQYRLRAREFQLDFAKYDALGAVAKTVESVLAAESARA